MIVNDDTAPTVSILDVSHAEGDSGTTPFLFTVKLSKATSQTVTVQYTTQNGTATGSDYTATSGTVTFMPDELTKVITVNVIGDTLNEANETFSVVLSSPSNATLGDATGIGTIQDEASDNVSILPSSVSGKVFVDGNGNGSQDGLDHALAGTQVVLTGTASLQTTSGADGSWAFNNLEPGTYTVTFILPSQYRTGTAHVGTQGGSTVDNGFTFTIDSGGGVTGTGNHFTTRGVQSQYISARMFLASTLGALLNPAAGEAQVAITPLTTPINAASSVNTTISGTGTAGATIVVVASDATTSLAPYMTTIAADGTWSIAGINVSSLADGTITFDVTAIGTGNATDQASTTRSKDTVAPAVTIGTVTDPVNSGNPTSVAISGTSEAGATISVTITDGSNTTAAQTTTVAAGGTWSLSGINVSSLTDGTITYSVTATDAAGNIATASQTADKDTTGPALAIATVTDPIGSPNQTNVAISGTGEPGAAISVVVTDGTNSTTAATATIDQDGNWSISGIDVTSLNDGTITFNVSATDGFDNVTEMSETAVKDTVTQVTASGVTDPINAAGQTAVTISGTGEAGATVSVVATDGVQSTSAMTVVIDSSGDWSISGIDVSTLADGTITFNVTSTDDAGNTATTSLTADKDTVAPSLNIEEVTDPIGINEVTSVALSGTTEPGASVSVVATDGTNSTDPVAATVDASGNWSIAGLDVSALADGTITFNLTTIDAAGNSSTGQTTATKTTIFANDVTDPITQSNEAEVAVSGIGQVGASVSVVATDGTHSTDAATVTVDEQGNWSVTMNVTTLDDGTITFNVTATMGGAATVEASITAQKDATAEGVILGVTNPINAAGAANTSINGTGELGGSVSVVATDGDGSSNTVTGSVQEDGTWSLSGIDVSGLADGDITYTVTVTDQLGNTTDYMTTAHKDTVAPVVGIVSTTNPVGIAESTHVEITGSGEVGDTISVVVTDGTNSTTTYMTTVDANEQWSITDIDVSALADGTLTFNVTATDAAGNIGATSDTTTKVTVAADDVTDPITQANQQTVTVSGTGQIGASISVVATDNTTTTDAVTTTIDEQGNWSVTIDVSTLEDGTLTFNVTATDGNENSAATSITAEKDTVATFLILDADDPITAALATSVGISGIAEAGGTISVVITDGENSTEPTVVQVETDGTWLVDGIDVTGLADGEVTFHVNFTDPLGNTATDEITVQKDTVAEVVVQSVTDPITIGDLTSTSIGGTGEVGATISVVVTDGISSTTESTTTVDQDGNWSIADLDVTALVDGTITFNVAATDTLGNPGSAQATATKMTIGVDQITDPINAENQDSVTLSGTSQNGIAVTVIATDTDTGSQQMQTTTDELGNWSVTFDLSSFVDGEITFDVAGTDGTNTAHTIVTATKDTVAEGAIVAATDPITAANAANVEVSGTGEVGATVSITAGDESSGTTESQAVVVGEDGTWSLTIDASGLADGTITFVAVITDLAGNTLTTDGFTSTKDTITDGTIDSLTDPIGIANSNHVAIGGTGEVGATISVVASRVAISTTTYQAVVDQDGNWSISDLDVSALGDGVLTFTVDVTDAVGNTKQLEATATKATLNLTFADPINFANQTAATVGGTGEIGATVSVVATDGSNTTDPVEVTVDGDGNWTAAINVSALDDGPIEFTASAAAGGNSIQSQIIAQKDTVALVTITPLAGPINSTQDQALTVTGTGETGAGISLVVSDGVTTLGPFTATVDESGNWTLHDLNLSSLGDGTLTFTVTTTDLAGNVGQAESEFEKDTMVPAAAISGVTNPINGSNQTAVAISGTGEIGATVSVVGSISGVMTDPVMTTVDGTGNWSIEDIDVSSLDDGTLTFVAMVKDAAGNTTVKTTTALKDTVVLVTIDSLTDPVNADNAASTTISGTGEVGATVSIVATDGQSTTSAVEVIVDGDGNWTANVDVSSLLDGELTYAASIADDHGNTNDAQMTTTKDTVVVLGGFNYSLPINASIAAAMSISGTGEPGAVYSITATDGVTTVGPTVGTTELNGDWTVIIDVSSLADGPITFTVTGNDSAGNSAEDGFGISKDTVAPAVEIDSLTDPVNADNAATTVISGTGEAGASIAVSASDGDLSSDLYTTTIDQDGNWTVAGIDVSAIVRRRSHLHGRGRRRGRQL